MVALLRKSLTCKIHQVSLIWSPPPLYPSLEDCLKNLHSRVDLIFLGWLLFVFSFLYGTLLGNHVSVSRRGRFNTLLNLICPLKIVFICKLNNRKIYKYWKIVANFWRENRRGNVCGRAFFPPFLLISLSVSLPIFMGFRWSIEKILSSNPILNWSVRCTTV